MAASDDLLWQHRRDHTWFEEYRAPEWPAGVHAVSRDGLLLGLDTSRRLYCDGKPVDMRRRLDLTCRQQRIAGATAAAGLLAGLNGLVQALDTTIAFDCARYWWAGACVRPIQLGRGDAMPGEKARS